MGVTSARRAATVVREQGEQSEDFERHTDEVNGPKPQSKPIALVIDDSTDIALLLVMILQSAGYEAAFNSLQVKKSGSF